MNTSISIPNETIISKIFFIRGKKVMFDKDLAELYGVETRTLNQAVKRNQERFPEDFMFKLNEKETSIWEQHYSLRSQIVILNENGLVETQNLRSQFVTSKRGKHIKYSPTVFTEQGVAMLSSVLKSKQAVQMNIQIIRTFTKLREILSENKKLAEKVEEMERKYDRKISDIFTVIKHLTAKKGEEEVPPPEPAKEPIGFRKG
jgi:hypothetical protein